MSSINFMGKLLDDVDVEWKALGTLGELVRGNGLQKKDLNPCSLSPDSILTH